MKKPTTTFTVDRINMIQNNADLIDIIQTSIEQAARSAEDGAGFSGGWGDGGAGQMRDKLSFWLDGYNFAVTGETEKYGHIIKKHYRDLDPEYKLYLDLKKKFEDD